MTSPLPPIVAGPRWYRTRIRTLGPLLGLIPPGVIGLVAWFSLRNFDSDLSGTIGLIGGVIAAPGLLVAGAPFADDTYYLLAVAASGVLWLLVGLVASRRATRSPMASFRDFWREYTWLAVGVAVGAVGALAVATVVLGESLV